MTLLVVASGRTEPEYKLCSLHASAFCTMQERATWGASAKFQLYARPEVALYLGVCA